MHQISIPQKSSSWNWYTDEHSTVSMASAREEDDVRNFHRQAKGKIRIALTFPIENRELLAKTYTPGVAIPARDIAENPEEVWNLTGRRNRVAIVSDGSAILGLGNIGPLAALPVME